MKVLLNDWSLAKSRDAETSVVGTLPYMPTELLGQGQHFKYHPQPCHDLESVVKIMYIMLFPGQVDADSHTEMRQFWETRSTLAFWAEMFQAANDENYGRLKFLISTIYL